MASLLLTCLYALNWFSILYFRISLPRNWQWWMSMGRGIVAKTNCQRRWNHRCHYHCCRHRRCYCLMTMCRASRCCFSYSCWPNWLGSVLMSVANFVVMSLDLTIMRSTMSWPHQLVENIALLGWMSLLPLDRPTMCPPSGDHVIRKSEF